MHSITNFLVNLTCVCACFFPIFTANSQDKIFEPCLRIEYSTFQGHEAIAGINHGHVLRTLDEYPYEWHGPFATIGAGCREGSSYWAGHLGYEYYNMFFGIKSSFIMNTDFHGSSFSFFPELGLTMAGAMSLMYGYQFNIYSNDSLAFQSHRIALSFTLPMQTFQHRRLLSRDPMKTHATLFI